MLGDFVLHWTFIQQIVFVLPPSFATFFLSMLFDGKESPGRASLFVKLNTPIDPSEIGDAPDFSGPVFRFLSCSVAGIGLASLLLLIPNPPAARLTILSFSGITLAVALSLWFVPSGTHPAKAHLKEAPHKI